MSAVALLDRTASTVSQAIVENVSSTKCSNSFTAPMIFSTYIHTYTYVFYSSKPQQTYKIRAHKTVKRTLVLLLNEGHSLLHAARYYNNNDRLTAFDPGQPG